MTDTAAKRASALLDGMVIPDGTLAQGDRQTAAYAYGGILAGALQVSVTCFLNLKSTVEDSLDLHSLTQNLSIKSVVSSAMNLRATVRSAFNLKSDVC